MNRLRMIFVIGDSATRKSYFIQHFSDKDIERLNVYDYQKRACKEAGIDGRFLSAEKRKYLHKANLALLAYITERCCRKVGVWSWSILYSRQNVVFLTLMQSQMPKFIFSSCAQAIHCGKHLSLSENCKGFFDSFFEIIDWIADRTDEQ